MISATRRRPVWLLDYDVGGRVYRWATEGIEVTDARGRTLRYEAGLEPLTLGSTRTLGRRDEEVSVHSTVDWAQLEGRGIAMEQRPAAVRLHYSGDVLEQSAVYLAGLTEDVRSEGKSEPLRFRIVEDLEQTARYLPNEQAVCNDDTWPVRSPTYSLGESAVGVAYPVPIGYPGDHPKPGAVADIAEPAYHAPWVEEDSADSADRFLIALGTIDAAQITLYEDVSNTVSSTDRAVATMEDGRGITVSYAQAGILNGEGGRQFYAGFRKASGYGGGVVSPYTGNVLRGAGEVARFLLDYFTEARLDEGRMLAYGEWLDRFKIDGVIGTDGPERVTDWLRSNVLEVLPVLLVDGPRGLYLAPLRWDAEKHHAVARIDIDKGHASPVGPIQKWPEPVYNKLTVEYRPRWGKDYVSKRTLTSLAHKLGDALTAGVPFPPLSTSLPWMASAESDTRVAGHSMLRASQARFGIREWFRQLPACWDDHTANLILYYMALRHAWPKRTWTVKGGHHLEALYPGDVVTVTSADHHLTEHVALIIERTVDLVGVALDLVLLDRPTSPRLTT